MEGVKKQGMESLFIPYEIALALKELGFDEPCIGWYNPQVNYKKVTTDNYWAFHLTGEWENFKPAPLYQQAFRFFREKYDLRIWIESNYGVLKFEYVIATTNPNFINKQFNDFSGYNTYEEAELECLKKLIEIVKKK